MKSTPVRVRRERRSAAEWQGIIDEQMASGQTIRAFADERGLNQNTVAWWRARFVADPPASLPPAFVEVTRERSSNPVGVPIEIVLPNGLVLTAAEHVDPTRFARLVAALVRPC